MDGAGARNAKGLEAEVMDLADDLAYNLHDVEDFYRAGLLPLRSLYRDRSHLDEVLTRWLNEQSPALRPDARIFPYIQHALDGKERDAERIDHPRQWIKNLLGRYTMDREYRGDFEERVRLHQVTSVEVGRIIESPLTVGWRLQSETGLWEPEIDISPRIRVRLAFFKRLVWRYVIGAGQLAQQQEAQRRTIMFLMKHLTGSFARSFLIRSGFAEFGSYVEEERLRRLIPASFSAYRRHTEEKVARAQEDSVRAYRDARIAGDPELLAGSEDDARQRSAARDLLRQVQRDVSVLRLAADVVASLTDGQAASLAMRLRSGVWGSWTMDGELG
jgi:dGTP triphosphohydrolase